MKKYFAAVALLAIPISIFGDWNEWTREHEIGTYCGNGVMLSKKWGIGLRLMSYPGGTVANLEVDQLLVEGTRLKIWMGALYESEWNIWDKKYGYPYFGIVGKAQIFRHHFVEMGIKAHKGIEVTSLSWRYENYSHKLRPKFSASEAWLLRKARLSRVVTGLSAPPMKIGPLEFRQGIEVGYGDNISIDPDYKSWKQKLWFYYVISGEYRVNKIGRFYAQLGIGPYKIKWDNPWETGVQEGLGINISVGTRFPEKNYLFE